MTGAEGLPEATWGEGFRFSGTPRTLVERSGTGRRRQVLRGGVLRGRRPQQPDVREREEAAVGLGFLDGGRL
jgi:hypothetical protein